MSDATRYPELTQMTCAPRELEQVREAKPDLVVLDLGSGATTVGQRQRGET